MMKLVSIRAALVLALSAFAAMAQAQVVVSQVYGGGGNSGAPLNQDFVELFNRGAEPASLAGLSVQYASATGTGNFAIGATLPAATLQPGQYFLVGMAGGANGEPLPTPDATGNSSMSASAGKIVLVDSTSNLACNGGSTPCTPEQLALIVDLVGYGGANFFEGAGPAPGLSNTTSAFRAVGGCTDSNDNGADFAAAAPVPRNTASAFAPCGGGGQPTLSIADVVVDEGNAGTATASFTVTLSQPAGPGGVTFDIATADGTATVADNDYVANVLIAQAIAEGATSYVFDVVVNGDTAIEPSETFTVDVSNVAGAAVGDAQAIGTIANDDVELVAIHDIQGPGAASPRVGENVATTGIVTARRSNGFFLQAPEAEYDADPLTSEGILVFTGAAPPAAAAVGNTVRVSGQVQEFVPSADPFQPPLTEIGGSVTVVQTGTAALPAPVELSATLPDPAGAFDQLERLEGMRVRVPSLTVGAPTDGFTSEPNATGTTNGVFQGVVTGVARPFREPGIPAPDPAPSGGGSIPPIPRFDSNPETLRVDSDALGAAALDVATGAVVTDLVGPLDYTFRRYTVLPDGSATPGVTAGPDPRAARVATANEFTVAAYNMERFFDTVNDPAIGEPVLTAEAFERRLGKASLAIRDYLHAPDVLGVVEMENLSTLQALAARINADAVAAGDADPQYVAHLEEGNDVGGIDVGFLVKTAEVAAGVQRVEVTAVTQVNKDEPFVNPDGSSELLNDRPPLLLEAVVRYADGRDFPVTVIVNHLRSLNDVNSEDPGSAGWSTLGERVRAKRQKQAESLANLVQARQTANPDERIVAIGDFNAFEFNDGLGDSIATISGTPTPDEQTAVAGDGADLVEPDLVNLAATLPAAEQYSFVFDGNAQTLDHVLANEPLLLAAVSTLDHARISADFPEVARNDSASPARLSDHDPAIAYFDLGAPSADLSLSISGPNVVRAGTWFDLRLRVNNAGGDPAQQPRLEIRGNLPGDTGVTAPDGWSCAPVTGGVSCTSAGPYAATRRDDIVLRLRVARRGVLAVGAAVASPTRDPRLANNVDAHVTLVTR